MGGELEGRLAEALAAHPDLAGWSVRVEVAEEETAESVDEAMVAEDSGGVGSGRAGPALADLLSEDREARLFAVASRFRGFPLAWLSPADLSGTDPDARAGALRQATLAAGCLMTAAIVVVDELFGDVETLRRAGDIGERVNIGQTLVLSALPPRFAHRFTAAFAQRFLACMLDVTRRFTGGWEPLSCVAQELALRVLLDEAEVQADVAEVELDPAWRQHLEESVFEDTDHELLYDPAWDGIENQPELGPPGMAAMRFESWFTPFNTDRPLPPYALDDLGGGDS
jgi:hypothetical protein